MKAIITIIIIVLLLAAGFGIWGYTKAQEVKKQGKALEQITADTMTLKEINQSDFEISLSDWKNLAEKSSLILSELEKIAAAPEALKNKISQFYSAKTQDKYKEAQYLQFLLDGQRKLDLKSTEPKSKGQIETILKEFDNLQNNLTKNNLSLGPEFDTQTKKLEQEAATYKTILTDLYNKMNSSSPTTQISAAGLDKAVDDLKQAIMKSLNDWVELQNDIKNDISGMANANWVNPLTK